MSIIDRRSQGQSKAKINRKKFLDRYKKAVKRSVEQSDKGKGITDILDGRDISIRPDTIDEPQWTPDPKSGDKDRVLPGNKQYNKGDKINKPQGGNGESGRQGSDSGEGDDEFSFTLSKEEFLELYFSDMALPNFVKKSVKMSLQSKFKRAGFVKQGIPPRLNVKKTFENAIARKISQKAQGNEKPPFLDDIDLRYDNVIQEKKPIAHAVMFCLMDVSASMGEFEKKCAKKFFLLLYLFLNKCYQSVEIRFIRHTQDADEVTEQEFFYGTRTGGTIVSSGLKLVNDIIDKEYQLSTTNIYLAQCSDGDNWYNDNSEVKEVIEERLLQKVQYFAYLEVTDELSIEVRRNFANASSLYDLYEPIAKQNQHFNIRTVVSEADIYPVLKDLFKRKGGNDE